MGYYDDHAQGRYSSSKGRNSGIILAGIVGVILGIFVLYIVYLSITHRDVAPNHQSVNTIEPIVEMDGKKINDVMTSENTSMWRENLVIEKM